MTGSHAAARLLAAGLVAFCALGASFAGGDDGERLTKAEFVARATKHCDKLLDASNDLRKAGSPYATYTLIAVNVLIYMLISQQSKLFHDMTAKAPLI